MKVEKVMIARHLMRLGAFMEREGNSPQPHTLAVPRALTPHDAGHIKPKRLI